MPMVMVALLFVAGVAGLWGWGKWRQACLRRQRSERRRRHLAHQSTWEQVFPQGRHRRPEHPGHNEADREI